MSTTRREEHMYDDDPILRDLETAVEYGMGTGEVWHVPEATVIPLIADGDWIGETHVYWPEAGR
jgi:hypothetical protein